MYDADAQDNGAKIMEKVVAILSGGLDSVTMLYLLHKQGYDCYPITFFYSQKHHVEIEYAKRNVLMLGLTDRHKIIDVSNLSDVLSSALIQESNVIPSIENEANRTQAVLKQTVVPFRNGIFLAIAAGYAGSRGISTVAYGAHVNDYATYPDCRLDFIDSMQDAIRNGLDDPQFKIWRPFLMSNKSKIVSIGKANGVDFTQTWSCYRGGTIHCGTCPSCHERKEAFLGAKIDDPTSYAV